MSPMRKALKVLSFLALIAGIDLAITLWVLHSTGEMQLDPLQVATMGLSAVLGLVAGALGIGAANAPSRIGRLRLPMWLGVWANLCNVLLMVLSGGIIPSGLVSLVIAAAFAYAAAQVERESGR